MNILQAIHDENLFKPFLGHDLETWEAWLTALRALYGLGIEGDEAKQLIRDCMGRDATKLPSEGFDVALFLTGRRSGKSRIAATIGAFEAVLAGHEKKLSAGERGVVLIASPTKSQSRIVKDYTRAIFETPLLRNEVARETATGFELNNGTRIEILAGDWKTVRGYSLIAAIIDEACFIGYGDDSKIKSDTELIRAIQPSLATVQGKLIAISSPYAPKGWCYRQWKRHFGKDSAKVLVWNAPSCTMNATLPQKIVDEAMEEDRAAALAEYYGQWRDDIATFLPREVIEACMVEGRTELLPQGGYHYSAFVDLSGGRVDSACLAIGHEENDVVVIDYLAEWKAPHNPYEVIAGMVADLRRYGINRIVGDRYSAEFAHREFQNHGIRYHNSTTNVWSKNPQAKKALPKSELYLELLPRLCGQSVELLDNDVLITQLSNLERRTRSGGRDIVDHGPGQHDDLANVVAGVVVVVLQKQIAAGVITFVDSDSPNKHVSPLDRILEREQDLRRYEHDLLERTRDSIDTAVSEFCEPLLKPRKGESKCLT